MISLIDYEHEMYPPTQLLVFQDTDSVSLLTLSKNKSWNTSDVQPHKMYSVSKYLDILSYAVASTLVSISYQVHHVMQEFLTAYLFLYISQNMMLVYGLEK